MEIEFRMLGPLELIAGGVSVPLGGAKQRAVLADLLIHKNELVSQDRLVEDLWGEDPPRTAANVVQVHVSAIRKALGRAGVGPDQVLLTRPPGYVVQVGPAEFDVLRFEALAGEGRALLATDPDAAVTRLQEALRLWRGSPLPEFAFESFSQLEIARLEELRLATMEDRIAAELVLGGDAQLVSELRRLVEEHPFRERPREYLMLALYRSGRQAEALELSRQTRLVLTQELGIDPSPSLQRLEAAILAQDPALEARDRLGSAGLLAEPQRPRRESPAEPRSPTPTQGRDGVITLPSEERKTVTVVICELAALPTASDALDPEDARAAAAPYRNLLRTEIGRYGGSVERVIGDTFMAVFGAPINHEDDPERAVRAALRVADGIEELAARSQQVAEIRIGIDTGEAVVAVDTAPEQAEGTVVGEVVNAASRVLAAAPWGDTVVGETTYRSTAHLFDYEPLEPLEQPRAGSPRPMYRAKAPHSRQSARHQGVADSTFVGRGSELGLLAGALERATHDRSVQLVTLVGEPGVGKSRLVAELFTTIDGRPGVSVRWREGRSLPYGEGITFWALGEIIKAEAGILESDDARTVGDKLERMLPVGSGERDWVRRRLSPLVGLDAPEAAREEVFTAWRRFFELIDHDGPTVLVFEDLHWADEAMLEFLEHLLTAVDIPLLILATARPELFERHPAWAGSARNAARLDLLPLSEDETSLLVGELLGRSELPPEVLDVILQRAEGSPLFAEAYVRLLKDRGVIRRAGSTWRLDPQASIPLPDGIHALIAARLDTVRRDQKAMLASAAVLGNHFWSGAVAAMIGAKRSAVDRAMQDLSRVDLVRRSRSSSLEGETEYTFWHALVRDVAYGQLPRATRTDRHLAAAAWIERAAGDRVGDHAEILAHHLTTALALSRAVGRETQAKEMESPAIRFLLLAGERAMALDAARAEVHLRQAIELAPPGHPRRSAVLGRLAEAVRLSTGNLPEAAQLCEEAIQESEAAGDREGAADLQLRLSHIVDYLGNQALARSLLDTVIARLGSGPPSAPLAMAYAHLAFPEWGAPFSEGIAWADRAIGLADQLDLPAVRTRALGARGISFANLGDPKGISDLRASLALSMELGLVGDTYITYNNLIWALNNEDPSAALELADEALSVLRAHGLAEGEALTQAYRLETWFLLGRWEELIAQADDIIEWAEGSTSWHIKLIAAIPKAWALSLRGDHSEAGRFADDICEGKEDRWLSALAIPRVRARRAAGRKAEAAKLLHETIEDLERQGTPLLEFLCDIARETIALGRLDLLARCGALSAGNVKSAQHGRQTWQGLSAEADERFGEALVRFADAEHGWATFGNPFERAQALLGQARCLVALGRPAEAAGHLRRAHETFAVLGARPALEETDSLLQRTSVVSA